MPSTRTVQIISPQELPEDITLIFTFDDHPGIFTEYFPIVWRASTIHQGTSPAIIPLTYTPQLAFVKTAIEDHVIIPGTYEPIEPGQTTTLIKIDQQYDFTKPVAGNALPQDMAEVLNKTGQAIDIAIGLVRGIEVDPTLSWKNVPPEARVLARLPSKVSGYIVRDYTQGQIIHAQMEAKVLEFDFLDPNTPNKYRLDYDSATGVFSINPIVEP